MKRMCQPTNTDGRTDESRMQEKQRLTGELAVLLTHAPSTKAIPEIKHSQVDMPL